MLKHPRHRRLAAQACLVVALASVRAHADAWSDWLAELSGLPAQTALQRLEQAPGQFRELADYYYWLGVYSQKAGMPAAQAIDHFEHALMLDPDHAGAWYDYGLALCQTGEQASCKAVLDHARSRFGLPPALQDRSLPRFLVSGEARGDIGYSSNLNAGSQAQSINLWLDGYPIPLLLADSGRAQPAWFAGAAFDLKLRPAQGQPLAATISAYARSPLQKRQQIGDYRVLAGEVGYSLAPDHRVGLHGYGMEDSRLGSLSVLGLWWQTTYGTGSTQTLLAAEQRNLSGEIPAYLTLRAHASTLLWRSLEGLVGAEKDLPHGDRPGHSQHRLLLGLNLPLQIMGKGRLDIAARWQHARDSEIYSPFFGDERRRLNNLESRLRFSWPLGAQIDLRTEARYTRQQSNIALYDYNERMISLGLVARF